MVSAPQSANDNQLGAPAPQGKPARWHYLYFIQAGFGIVVVLLSMALNHMLVTGYTQAERGNALLAELQKDLLLLARLTTQMDAPGNDVFISKDPDAEKEKFDALVEKASSQTLKVRETLKNVQISPEAEDAIVARKLSEMNELLKSVYAARETFIETTNNVFAHYKAGDEQKASEYMAQMDQLYSKDSAQLSEMTLLITSIGQYLATANADEASMLAQIEYLVAALVALLIVATAYYGLRLIKQYQREQRARDYMQQIITLNEKKYRSLITNVPCIFFSCNYDADWTMNFINDQVEEMTGYPASDFISNNVRSFASVIHPEDSSHVTNTIAEQFGKNQDYTVEYRVMRKDGRELWVHEQGTAVRDEAGNAKWIEGFIQDISARKLAEMELEKHRNSLQELVNEQTRDLVFAKDKAEAANKAKSEFLSNMSHELRTPMHAILNFTKMTKKMVDKDAVAEQKNIITNLDIISTSATRLMGLLNNLLDLAKLESGRMEFRFNPTNLKDTLQQCLHELDSLLKQKNITVKVETPIAVTAAFDNQRMMQVFINLLSNAIKFSSDQSEITVRFESVKCGKTVCHPEGAILCVVEDKGIGIPEEELDKVFDKFIQSSKSKTGAGGTGLGLSICKEIVEAHRGEIWAENSQNGGACFKFTIPLGLVNEAKAA